MPQICVVVVAYRSDATIGRCLESLEGQSFRDFEVIIVDNGLTPALTTAVAGKQMMSTLLKPDKNLGFAGGNNFAVNHAADDTQWIALLNPDAFARSDWLQNFTDARQKYPHVPMFGSLQLEAARENICDGAGDCYHIFGLAWRRGHGRALPAKIKDCESFAPCAASSFYAFDAFRAAGGFDEDYFCYFEDVDLGFRIRLQRGPCVQLADAVVLHVGGVSGSSDFAIEHALRNIVWTFVKDMPNPYFLLFMLPMLAAVCALALRYTLSGNGKAAWTGLANALKGWRPVWRKRAIIQKSRKVPVWSVMKAMTWFPVQPLRHLFRKRERSYFAN